MRALDRVATRILFFIGRRKWGLSAVLMPSIVETLGPFGAIRWFAKNIPTYELAIKDLGPMRANLLFAAASLLNGCSYCTYAHGRAFELYYFERNDTLFPLNEHELISLIPLTDDAMRSKLEDALRGAGLEAEITMLARLYVLKLEGATPTPADRYIMHAIQMYDTLNYCAVESQATLDDAHDRINKDEKLKARYSEARLAAGRKDVTIGDIQAVEQENQLAKTDEG